VVEIISQMGKIDPGRFEGQFYAPAVKLIVTGLSGRPCTVLKSFDVIIDLIWKFVASAQVSLPVQAP
jgi:hypothetical protein